VTIRFFSILTSFFFPISPIQTCQKILNIFMVVYSTNYRFYERILKTCWIFIKKNRDIGNIQHFQNSIVYYFAFLFFCIFDIFFSILPVYSFKKFLKFLCCFIIWIRDFFKEFCKIMVYLKKKFRYLKSKISPKFCHLLFLFYFFKIFDIFFFISLIQGCQKIMEFLVVFYWKD